MTGTPVTLEFITKLSERQRVIKDWPIQSFMAQWMSNSAMGFNATVERIMERWPPEKYPGYYERSICSTCHGNGGHCFLCGGTGCVCSRCRNYGRVYDSSGRAEDCTSCDLLKRRAMDRIEEFWSRWGLTEEEKGWRFEAGSWHDPRWDGQPWIVGFRRLAAWLEVWAGGPTDHTYRWIVMVDERGQGNYGQGKSYLGTATVIAALENGQYAHKWLMADLLDVLRDQYSPAGDMTFAQWFKALCGFPGILFLDEFGKEKLTHWVEERLTLLLTYRAERAWLPTMIAGNVSYGELKATLPWLASRMNEGRVLRPDMAGFPDWRTLLRPQVLTVPEEL